MNGRDIVKVGFAVLAAVVSYNFADTIVHAEENSVEPIKETTNTQESDNLSIPRTQSHTVQHSEPPVPSCRATQSINQSHLYTFSCKMYL